MTTIDDKKLTEEEYKEIREQDFVNKYMIKKMGIFGKVLLFPPISKLLTALAVFAMISLCIQYWPLILQFYLTNYSSPADASGLLQYSGILNIFLLCILCLFYFTAGSVAIPFTWAALTGKPISAVITKNNILKFIVPWRVLYNVWELVKDATMEQDPEAMLIAPNRVRVQIAIPEIGKGLNVRRIALENAKTSIDMNTYFRYGQQKKIEGRTPLGFNWANMTPTIIMIMIMVLIGAYMYPTIEKRFDQDGKIMELVDMNEQCKYRLAEHGIKINDLVDKESKPVPPEANMTEKPAMPSIEAS